MQIRGYFGIGVYNMKKGINYGTLFRSANCFGADFIFLVGRRFEKLCSDTMRTERHCPLYEYQTMADFYEHLPHGCQLVGVEICARAKPLETFGHPAQAAYILGPEDGSLPPEVLNRCHHIVRIDTNACLNVSVAGSIVLYDRNRKVIKPKEAQHDSQG